MSGRIPSKARRYPVRFSAVAPAAIVTQTLSFNVPYGAWVIGITGGARGQAAPTGLDAFDVDIRDQNGEAMTIQPVQASTLLGTGERPYNLHDSPKPLTPNTTLTIVVTNQDANTLATVDVVFWVVERITPPQADGVTEATWSAPAVPLQRPLPPHAPSGGVEALIAAAVDDAVARRLRQLQRPS